MLTNRTMPRCTVIPELVYEDVDEAVRWLCDAFGFRLRWQAGDHRAQLAVGEDGCVVVMDPWGDANPARAELSHGVMVRVDDARAHHERAAARGARILRAPTDFPYGERQYNAEDIGGHRWTFTESIADVAPEEWGGASGPALD